MRFSDPHMFSIDTANTMREIPFFKPTANNILRLLVARLLAINNTHAHARLPTTVKLASYFTYYSPIEQKKFDLLKSDQPKFF